MQTRLDYSKAAPGSYSPQLSQFDESDTCDEQVFY